MKAIFRRSLFAPDDGRFTEHCSTYSQRARIAAGENAWGIPNGAAAGGEELPRDDMITETGEMEPTVYPPAHRESLPRKPLHRSAYLRVAMIVYARSIHRYA